MAEIELDEDLALLAQSAGDFMQAHGDLSALRTRMTSQSGFDAALFRQMAELGWTGVAIDEVHSGSGLGARALVLLHEAAGRCLFGSPLLATTLAGQVLSQCDDDVMRRQWLPALARGEAIGSVALVEPDGSWELGRPQLQAERVGDGYQLSGAKLLVLDAAAADLVVVSARAGDGPALFALDRGQLSRATMRREVLIDEVRRAYRIDFDALAVPASSRVAGDASRALERLSLMGALLVSAEMVGGTAGVMELTLEYLRTRKQFGRLIGGYQALKHPMVEILASYEQSRSLLYAAATALDARSDDAEVAVRMAKAHGGDTFAHAADRAIQFHGAIGFTYECHAQLFLRRAQWAQYTFGDSSHHRSRLQRLLLG